mmetsp:Transcript_20888/g.40840  ORF Transcript_20888/g.40840 Transcript_20888/m.40840 type:complete len:92 (-) Transcript_20888:55-330(-)
MSFFLSYPCRFLCSGTSKAESQQNSMTTRPQKWDSGSNASLFLHWWRLAIVWLSSWQHLRETAAAAHCRRPSYLGALPEVMSTKQLVAATF